MGQARQLYRKGKACLFSTLGIPSVTTRLSRDEVDQVCSLLRFSPLYRVKAMLYEGVDAQGIFGIVTKRATARDLCVFYRTPTGDKARILFSASPHSIAAAWRTGTFDTHLLWDKSQDKLGRLEVSLQDEKKIVNLMFQDKKTLTGESLLLEGLQKELQKRKLNRLRSFVEKL